MLFSLLALHAPAHPPTKNSHSRFKVRSAHLQLSTCNLQRIHSPAHPPYPAPTSCGPFPPFTKNRTAILTANPLVTCSKINDRVQSAISLSISTPRLIGPG